MSIKLTSAAWTRAFTPPQQLVIQALAYHADDGGLKVFPGLRLIALKTGYSERQVKRVMAELVELGSLILVTPATRTRPNEYRIYLDAVPAKRPVSGDKVSPNVGAYQGTSCPNGGTSCPDQGTSATTSGDICSDAIRKKDHERSRKVKPFKLTPVGDSEFQPVDPRHGPIRALIQECHLRQFRVNVQWDGSEASALDRLLTANPTWSEEQITQMVRNRFASDGITGSRPRKWIPSLDDFCGGPLDRFNKPKKGGHASGTEQRSREQRRQAANLIARESVRAQIMAG